MSRPIKFKYVFKHYETGEIRMYITDIDALETNTWGPIPDWEDEGFQLEDRLQYVGLTDRNGKEIWDGDIVQARERSDIARFKGYVHFRNGQYWVNYIGYESYYVSLIQLVNAVYEPIEVIGHMYEQQDQLTGQNDGLD